MIRIIRDGTTVAVIVRSGLSSVGEFHFPFPTSTEWVAELLATQLQTNLSAMVKEIRRAAYERGWREAKSKKNQKETFFSGVP